MKEYIKDNMKLQNRDCMEGMAEYPDNYFDLAIVDPPYGIGADESQNKLGGKKGFTNGAGTYKKYHDTKWDKEVPEDNYFNEIVRVSKNHIVWGGNYFAFLGSKGVIIWYKGNSGNFKEGELAKTSINTFKVFQYSRADAYINDCQDKIHPTQKPVKLYSWLLQNYSSPEHKILDTHLGSASHAIAWHYFQKGGEFVGFELDEEYFEKSIKRIEQETAQISMF